MPKLYADGGGVSRVVVGLYARSELLQRNIWRNSGTRPGGGRNMASMSNDDGHRCAEHDVFLCHTCKERPRPAWSEVPDHRLFDEFGYRHPYISLPFIFLFYCLMLVGVGLMMVLMFALFVAFPLWVSYTGINAEPVLVRAIGWGLLCVYIAGCFQIYLDPPGRGR